MAKLTNSFKSKGELDLSRGIIYEIKKLGKGEEEIVEVDFFGFLKEFDGKNVSISITEDKEVTKVEDDIEEDEEEIEDEEY